MNDVGHDAKELGRCKMILMSVKTLLVLEISLIIVFVSCTFSSTSITIIQSLMSAFASICLHIFYFVSQAFPFAYHICVRVNTRIFFLDLYASNGPMSLQLKTQRWMRRMPPWRNSEKNLKRPK